MTSILTNNSAIVALQTLKSVNAALGKTQSDIATGKSVANAKDNAAVWAISKVMETDQSAAKTIQSNLNVADATISTARTGAESVTKLLNEVKDLALGATVSGADFAKIDTDIGEKFKQITAIVSGTQMNGVNLLKTGTPAEDADGNPILDANDDPTYEPALTVVGSLDRTNGVATTAANEIKVASINLEGLLGLELDSEADAYGTSTNYTAITDTTTAKDAVTAIEGMIEASVNGASALGSAGKRVTDQADFVGKLADSLKQGIGSLVDADMEEASARLQALQTQQQLGIQSLSIANQAPGAVMSLFR